MASGLSAFGDELALIALTIKVHDLSGSGFAVSALLLAGLLPYVVLAPVAGLVVDRYENARLLGLVSAGQALVAAALAFAEPLPVILALSFVLGAGAAVANPCVYSLVPLAVGEEHVTRANGYLETASYAGMLLAPFVAGGLSQVVGTQAALLADAASFLVIALAAAMLSVRRVPEEVPRGKSEARAGFQFIRRDRLLLLAVVSLAVMILFAAIDNVAEIFFAADVLDAGAFGYGLLTGSWLIGMVLGASLIGGHLERTRLVPGMLIAAIFGGVGVFIAAAVPNLALATAMFAIGGIANGVEVVSIRSLLVLRSPEAVRGRVLAAWSAVSKGTQIGAYAAGGVLVTAMGARAALVIGGLGTALVGVLGLVRYGTLGTADKTFEVQPAFGQAPTDSQG